MENKKIPTHIAVILDGNGRWAQKRKKVRTFGHKNGANKVIDILLYAKKRGIKYLTLYAFSTENRKRPVLEVNFLMKLLSSFIEDNLDLLIENKAKLTILGDISKLPTKARKSCELALEKTKYFDEFYLNIALNYGGRDDVVTAVRKIVKEGIDPEDITEKTISDRLYTGSMPDPDLLIRTGGDLRISNFLIYQIAYCEFYFTDVLWPDFNEEEFDKALASYAERDRRYGGINESI